MSNERKTYGSGRAETEGEAEARMSRKAPHLDGDPNVAIGAALADQAHRQARQFTGGRPIPARRPATPEDIERLTGTPEHPDVPYGLERCERCGKWQGECLRTGTGDESIVIFVRCVCHKEIRCETCGALMFERLPGLPASYFYDEDTRKVTHITTLASLLGHRCKGEGDGSSA